MDNTTKQFLLFEDGAFKTLTPAGTHTLSDSEIEGLKSGYVIVISDSELFYTTMEFPEAPKRKLDLFISNYLQGTFPQALCSKFCYLKKGDNILIGMFNGAFEEAFTKYESVFSKASYISSPLAGIYSKNDNFTYLAAGMSINVEDGLIDNAESIDEPIAPDMAPPAEAKLTVPFVKSSKVSLGGYQIPAAVLLICILLFGSGSYLRLKGYKDQLFKAEAKLEQIYKKAGVSNSRDPYGKMLALAGGGNSGSLYKTLFILEDISKAFNSNITTNTLDIKQNTVTIQGTSSDYTFLEQFQKELSKAAGGNVQIADTSQKDGNIVFTLRVSL